MLNVRCIQLASTISYKDGMRGTCPNGLIKAVIHPLSYTDPERIELSRFLLRKQKTENRKQKKKIPHRIRHAFCINVTLLRPHTSSIARLITLPAVMMNKSVTHALAYPVEVERMACPKLLGNAHLMNTLNRSIFGRVVAQMEKASAL